MAETAIEPGDRRLTTIIGWCLVVAGAALSTLPWFGQQPELRSLESAFAAMALGLLVSAPGVMVLIGGRAGRPGMLLPAAIALVPLSFISFALVTLPLLIPSVLLFRVVVRSTTDGRWTQTMVAGFVGAAALVIALGCYISLTVERSWSHADGGGGSTSGWVPWPTSLLVISLAVLAISSTWAITSPPRRGGGT